MTLFDELSNAPRIRPPNNFGVDGKRPNGFTLVLLQNGQCLTWDAMLVDSLATSYLSSTFVLPGSTSAVRKR